MAGSSVKRGEDTGMIFAGIDEAGYGPTLGPLCVGMTAFELDADPESPDAPDLWKTMAAAVCRKGVDARARVAVADSKALKASSGHPLRHLERGVLAFAGAWLDGAWPRTDTALWETLGAHQPDAPWYEGAAILLPTAGAEVGGDGGMGIAGNLVRSGLAGAGVSVRSMGCRIFGEAEFNRIVSERGSKAETTLEGMADHLGRLARLSGAKSALVICDRLGGRQAYGPALSRAMKAAEFPAWVDVLEETPEVSRYGVRSEAGRWRVEFRVKGESGSLPTALASMIAKLSREILMMRFNRHWSGRCAELKPTAGYYTDAQRWLADADGAMSPDERDALVRIA